MKLDRSRIAPRDWTTRTWDTRDGPASEGISLRPSGVTFWCRDPSEEMFGGGSYQMSFREFQKHVREDSFRGRPPEHIIEAIEAALAAARV